MALINHAKKEINAKIVYYGPAASGKNSALTYIYSRIKPTLRGDLKNVPAGADNLLFFDFSPFEAPLPNGYRVRLHVYTLTGSVANPATWKMTLKGADGIVIMVDPDSAQRPETRECVSQLRDFLSAYGVGLHDIPAILQLNSFFDRDQPDDMVKAAAALDLSMLATCSSNAARGEGLLEALATLSRVVLDRITVKDTRSETGIDPQITTEPESAEPSGPAAAADHQDMPHAIDEPRVALIAQEIAADGGTIRIPLEIMQGDSLRRVVITVNVALE
jgi:signal recognition particle receptor subunit beta